MAINNTPGISNPSLLDYAIRLIQNFIKYKCDWIDYSFPRAQRMSKIQDGNKIYYPAIYLDSHEYINVLPDQDLGNFSFFIAEDPQTIEFNKNRRNYLECPVSVIFWFNIEKIILYHGTDSLDINTEFVKAHVLRMFSDMKLTDEVSFMIDKIYDKAENIYSGFTIDEINTQFLMYPFSGFRIHGIMRYKEDCQLSQIYKK